MRALPNPLYKAESNFHYSNSPRRKQGTMVNISVFPVWRPNVRGVEIERKTDIWDVGTYRPLSVGCEYNPSNAEKK